MINKDIIIERLQGAIRAGIGEVRRDPTFLFRMAKTIAEELGLDAMAAGYLANKIKNRFREGEHDA